VAEWPLLTMDHDPACIDDYIAGFPREMRMKLGAVRATIRQVVPEATETISYGMPTFRVDGRDIVHLAGLKRHVSLYPVPDGDEALEADLAAYRAGTGPLQFPVADPIPHELVRRVVLALLARRWGGMP
jgi:uncharacterized protein YdhG (YjbR/CyaY superfamily)